MHFDGPDPFRGIRKQILMSYGFTPQRAEKMLDDPMLSNNRWTPLRYQVAQMIDQAKDGDAQAQEELRYFKQLFPGVRQAEVKPAQPTVMKPVAPGHILDTKRVGTETRHRTLEWLQWAYAEGCLDDADFDARQQAAMKAQTQPELDALTADLNEMPAAAPAPVQTVIPVKPGAGPGSVFGWANLLVWSALGAFTVMIMVGMPVAAAGALAVILGNALAGVKMIVDDRRASA